MDPDLKAVMDMDVSGNSVANDHDLQNIMANKFYGDEPEQTTPAYTRRDDLLRMAGANLTRPISQDNALLDVMTRVPISQLMAAGGLMQRAESLASVLPTAQAELYSGKPVTANPLKALTGEDVYEFGDPARIYGVPEPVAAGIGLLSSAVVDPAAIVTRALTMKGIETGMKAAGRWQLKNFLTGDNKRMFDAALADNGIPLKPEYLDPKKYVKSIDDFSKSLEPLYVKASDAMDEAYKIIPEQTASPELINMADELLSQYERTIAEPSVITRMRKKFQDAITNPKRGLPKVRDVVDVYRTFGKTSSKDVVTHKLEQELRDAVSREVSELRTANDLWSAWANGQNAAYNMGVDVKPMGKAGRKFLMREPSSGLAPLGQYDDPLWRWESWLGELQTTLASAGIDPTDIMKKAKEVSRATIGHHVAKLPMPEVNLAPAGGFLLGAGSQGAQIAGGVAASRIARRGLAELGPRLTYNLLNPKKPVPMYSVWKETVRKLQNKQGGLTPLGKAMAESVWRAGGMAASEAAPAAARAQLMQQE